MNIPPLTHLSRFLMAAFVAVNLAACTSSISKPESVDYRQTHKIKVTSEQVTVSISVPFEGTSLSPGDASRFKAFLRDYVQRGRTMVTVESTQPRRAREVLLAYGLRDGELFIASSTTIKAPNVILSFTANEVISPECGDWTGEPSYTPSNGPHTNFGCSIQRNISKMVSDPGDLIQSQPASGGNASRSDVGIFTHQSGAPKVRLLDSQGAAITGN
ncbi:MAG: hypothetical protein JKY27_09070 [Magnetovibrio sp.]|nr:hypothetical protein [Magnetovibrio sp.]